MLRSLLVSATILSLSFCPAGALIAQDATPTLEFRLADDAATSGWKKRDLRASDEPIFVSDAVALNGSHIEKVSFYHDPSGNPCVGLTLSDEGAKAMEAVTSQNVRKKLAIVLNGKVVSAPTIQSTIKKEVQITGRFDHDDLLAFFRAIVLRDNP